MGKSVLLFYGWYDTINANKQTGKAGRYDGAGYCKAGEGVYGHACPGDRSDFGAGGAGGFGAESGPAGACFSYVAGILCKELGPDGKNRNVPTREGLRLGVSAQLRQSQDGDYLAAYYDPNAQRFLLDHLYAILQT